MSRAEDVIFSDLNAEIENDPGSGYAEAAALIRSRYSAAQKEAAEDPATYKAVLACRRTGKSYWAASELVCCCLETPFANCLYVTLTKGSGRAILWNLLKMFNRDFGLQAHFHNTNLTITFKNGSMLSLVGAENRSEIDKMRGQGYDKIVIDECKSFPPDVLEELINEVLMPALMDRMGNLSLIGTPGAILAGPFFEITSEKIGELSRLYRERTNKDDQMWSVHIWSLDDAALGIIKEKAYEIKRAKKWPDDHPVWAREYLGKWIPSANAIVYRFNWEGRDNTWVPDEASSNKFGLPDGHEWIYLIGVDFGFNDDFAVEVAAYSPTHPNLYQIWDYKSPHLTVDDIARVILGAESMVGEYEVCVGDSGGLGKTIIASLAAEYGINIIPAEKKEKLDYIELLNNDLLSERCLVTPGSNLAQEWPVLQFDSSGIKEHPGCANHASDAFLYLWRYAYHRFHHELQEGPKKGSREWWYEQEREAARRAGLEVLKRQHEQFWELEDIDQDPVEYLPQEDACHQIRQIAKKLS